MARSITVVGANGQLGSDLMRILSNPPWNESPAGLSHKDIEVTDIASVRAAFERTKPRLVINTSAFHKVDIVEDQPDQAFAVNAVGPRNLAIACSENDAVLVHISTDYVFSGSKGSSYVEVDHVDPINVYGASKAAGEMLIRYLWSKHFIVRSSGLYGVAGPSGKGSNFVELMLRLGSEGKPIKVVNDQILTPTPTQSLGEQILTLSNTDAYGTYHATCQGECSWFAFAAKIFEIAGLKPSLSPQTTAESGAKARRPPCSVLENRNLILRSLDRMPHWIDGLRQYIHTKR